MSDERMVKAFGYVGFETAQTEPWLHFARSVLGAMVGDVQNDSSTSLRLDERALRIALIPSDGERLGFIGWEVADAAALAAVRRRLADTAWALRDAEPHEVAARRVQAMAWTVDPAGTRIEFFHGPEDAPVAFTPGRPISGFLTGELGLGHLVLQAADPAATVAFYRDVLGFRLSDRLRDALYFLGCNPRHHSIGIANIGGGPRVLHLMLEVLDIDDVGRAFDLCVDQGIRASMMGLHENDRMTSFYVTTPSGFEIEYGWHGLLVDDNTWTTGVMDRPSVWGHRQLDMGHPPTRRGFQQIEM